MVRSAELSAREARIAELKQLITSRHYDSLEKLEEAVEAFLWGEEDAEVPAAAVGNALASRQGQASPASPVSPGITSRAFRGPLNPR